MKASVCEISDLCLPFTADGRTVLSIFKFINRIRTRQIFPIRIDIK